MYVVDSQWLAVMSAVFAMGFFSLTVIVLLRRAFGGVAVTADTIAGAICAYLLLGVVWAFAFSLVELAHPGSFLVCAPMAFAAGTPSNHPSGSALSEPGHPESVATATSCRSCHRPGCWPCSRR